MASSIGKTWSWHVSKRRCGKALARQTGRTAPPVIALAVLVGCAGVPASKPAHADLTDSDVTLAVATMETALEHASQGESRTWRNPETGREGAVMPGRTYVSGAGSYCRDFQETLTANGRSATYASTACRDDDGIWHWVESNNPNAVGAATPTRGTL